MTILSYLLEDCSHGIIPLISAEYKSFVRMDRDLSQLSQERPAFFCSPCSHRTFKSAASCAMALRVLHTSVRNPKKNCRIP